MVQNNKLISDSIQNAPILSGAEALLEALVLEETETIFGYPGGAIMPVYDALYHYENKIKHVLCRHEQGCIHAAQGYARASGKIGVVMATSGPGATNLLTGLADAMADSTPLVCITGQVAAHLIGTDAFQEADVINMTNPVTKWNYQITQTEEIPQVLAKAFYIARSGRPGPVLIDIAKNAQVAKAPFFYQKYTHLPTYPAKPTLNHTAIQEAAALINQAKKPYLLVGQGVLLSKAEDVLKQLVEKTGIPVASTLLGLSAISTTHPLYVGYLGMHGNYACNLKTNECDVLIAVGMRFDDRVTGNLGRYAKQAKIIHIDIDHAEINKLVKTTVGIQADAKEALLALLPLLKQNEHKDWIESFKVLYQIEFEKVIEHEWHPSKEGLTMAEVIHLLGEMTDGEAITVSDVGQHQMVVSRYYPYKLPYSNLTSGGAGTMGFALPAALGAKLGAPNREVICIAGDGGIQMTMQELATIFQYKIPVKVIVLNNEFLGMVRQWQELFFERRYSQTDLINPNFIKLAEAYGIEALQVSKRANLKDGLAQMLASKEAFFLEVKVTKEDNVFPMIPAGAGVDEVLLAP